MDKSCKFNYLFNVTLCAIAIILAITPANALPEQNINTVVKWAKTRPQLPTLRYNSEAHGYEGTKGKLYFYADVTSENRTVTKEGITVSGDSSLKFTTKNAKAVKLLQILPMTSRSLDISPKLDVTNFIAGKSLLISLLRYRAGQHCR